MGNRILISPEDLHDYRQYIEQRNKSAQGYEDPEFMRRFHAYLVSKEAYLREFKKSGDLVMAHFGRPGPRRQVDLYRLNMMRRFFERDAYHYFNYRPHMSMASPFGTTHNVVAGYSKDASIAQLINRDDRANDSFSLVREEVEKHCKEVYDAYQRTDDPIPDSLKYAIVVAAQLVDLSGTDTPNAQLIMELLSRLTTSGEIQGAYE
jgi:hypothetical protein